MELLISRAVYQVMLAHVQDALPLEACGILAGHDNFISQIYFIDNILRSTVTYEMNAQQQIEAMLHVEDQGLELIASYHSHPVGPSAPSATDVAQAYYPDLAQIIIALGEHEKPSTRAFKIIEGAITERQILVIDR